jgi:hypothetical protein
MRPSYPNPAADFKRNKKNHQDDFSCRRINDGVMTELLLYRLKPS